MAFKDICEIQNTDSGRTISVEILEFREHDTLSVSIDRQIKLVLKWNGKVYVGNQAGMEFTSFGPELTRY